MNYGSGKTLQSGPNDHVFLYFSDHGAKGLVAFPDTILHAKTLEKTLKEMNANKQYAKMTIYIEACESGSMFKGLLPNDIDIYATTASNGTTSSYACYYDDKLKTYLGDVYSVKWMEGMYRTHAIITRGLYIFYPILKTISLFSMSFFHKILSLCTVTI